MNAQQTIVEPSFVHDLKPDEALFTSASNTLKLLAEPTRLHLLWLLVENEHNVAELVDSVGVSRTVVSQHLAKLRLGGLVESRREGRNIIYRVVDGHLSRLVLETLNHADHMLTGEPLHE
ncbi:winged helix-turn-helix transcriptional regulator [Corynebacterium canis]|uniref:Winged helix-turn-helix transcriptional regulator n=1 Tax=Corynebacterium canis TaxID=679663 RepID=A0A5C5US09_9CORY|nr:metalloregulator ArsR/SmtB family transcription factor [Corynebacterium canis]TWT28547.1 winged helix-turn-helix transcriptional regulator [Corynebacterium canis]WJY75863.1 HTH-type transcriptional regulator KmtR [Corynebacterium canis]